MSSSRTVGLAPPARGRRGGLLAAGADALDAAWDDMLPATLTAGAARDSAGGATSGAKTGDVADACAMGSTAMAETMGRDRTTALAGARRKKRAVAPTPARTTKAIAKRVRRV